MTRRAAERRGRRAETLAAWWLRLHGWRVLDRRVKARVGEVDLVVKRGGVVAFVEVKARSKAFDLAHAIDERRLARVAAAANALAPRYVNARDDVRIDVMLIGRGWPQHLANVWHGG